MDEAIERDSELADLLAEMAVAEGAERAEVLLGAGHRLLELGRGEEALAAVASARELFETASVSGPLGMCMHNEAVVLLSLGRLDESLDQHLRAVELFRQRFDTVEAAQCTVHVADTLRQLGRNDEALAAYGSARDELEAEAAGDCAIRRADLLLELDRFEEALGELLGGRELVVGCVSCVARCVERISDAFAGLGRLDEALGSAEEAIALWDACGEDDAVTSAELKAAGLLVQLGRSGDALNALHGLRAVYREEGDAVGVARCDRTAAHALETMGDNDEASRLRRTAALVLAAAGLAA